MSNDENMKNESKIGSSPVVGTIFTPNSQESPSPSKGEFNHSGGALILAGWEKESRFSHHNQSDCASATTQSCKGIEHEGLNRHLI